jgi:hypothetical protein
MRRFSRLVHSWGKRNLVQGTPRQRLTPTRKTWCDPALGASPTSAAIGTVHPLSHIAVQLNVICLDVGSRKAAFQSLMD